MEGRGGGWGRRAGLGQARSSATKRWAPRATTSPPLWRLGVWGAGRKDREESPTHIFSISSFSSKAPGRSRLLPRTRTCREGRAGLGPGQQRPGCPGRGAGFRSPVASAPLPPPALHPLSPAVFTPTCPQRSRGLPGEPPTLPLHSGLTGMPCSWGLSSRLWSSFLEASIFSWSAASTMYLGGGRWGQADTTGCGVVGGKELQQLWVAPRGLQATWDGSDRCSENVF